MAGGSQEALTKEKGLTPQRDAAGSANFRRSTGLVSESQGGVENQTIVVLNATPFRRMSIITKNGLIGLAVLCTTLPVMLVAQPAEKKTLVGVWEVKTSAGGVPPPPLLSIAIFGGDGSFTTTGNTKFSLAPPFQGLADQRGPPGTADGPKRATVSSN